MVRKIRVVSLALVSVAGCYGCATVDPRLDYDRAAGYITAATGHEHIYRPGEEAVAEARLRELMSGGLTASEAVEVCLLNNRRLQAAFFEVGLARADVVQSGLLSNPSLGVSMRFPSGGGLANLEVGLAQNIAELWQIPARQRAAQGELERAILELARFASALALESKETYYRAVAAEERHKLTIENLSLARNLLELAETRQQAGAGTELDVNLSRTVLIEAELALESARLEAAEARRELATLLGLGGPASDLDLVTPLPEVPPELPEAERLIQVARQARLDLRAARQAVLSAEARLEKEYRRVFPTIEIGVGLERAERKRQGGRDLLADTARSSIAAGGLTAPGIQPRSERNRHNDFIIGPTINLELPIFDQNQAQIARARYAYQQAAKTLEALDHEVTQEVRGVVDRALTAWRLLKVYRERSLPLAESNLNLSREAYRAGRASFLSVLEAQRFFLETRRRYVEAAENAAVTIPQVERTIGLPFEELIERARSEPESATNGEVKP